MNRRPVHTGSTSFFLKLTWLVLLTVSLNSCSYIASFYVCNASGADIIVSYSRRYEHGYDRLFSDSPTLHAFDAKRNSIGDEMSIGAIERVGLTRITVTIPAGTALRTGSEVNPWMCAPECFPDLDRLMIILSGDTTVLPRKTLHSFVIELDGQDRGIVIR